MSYQKFEGDTKKEFHFGTPKTESSNRSVPLNQAAKTAVMKQILQKRVVSSRYKCAYISEINLMRDTLDQIENFTPHCFRHTFATRAIELGMKPKVLQKGGG